MKTLMFLCDNYPIAAREFFVDDEMRVIAPYFEKILVLTSAQPDGAELQRYVTENMEVRQFSRTDLETQKWKSIWRLFTPLVLTEICFVVKTLPVKYWLQAFKILFVEVHRAFNLKKIVKTYCRDVVHRVSTDCVFYSYWHDYKAMAIALMRKDNSNIKCYARAHRWDVFAEENNPPYLPFKNFVIENLSKTISISEAGKSSFESYLSRKLNDKVLVSRLGKFNDRIPLFEKTNDDFVICSCSDIRADKRVDKIIDVLSQLKTKHVRWIHIGDDKLRSKIECYASEKLAHVEYEFKGIIPNREILNFYADNFIDMFINLSETEGIPVSIMEALSAGIPVVATNVGGTSEAVNQDNGFLVNADFTVEEVAGVIDGYFLLPIEEQIKYRQRAYEYWRTNFEAGRNYTNFVKILLS
ncbi:MAG: glycosyltransferase [Bacteroidales bacterium]|nr:glycosyltransferase [Bacteroidales bacterium]